MIQEKDLSRQRMQKETPSPIYKKQWQGSDFRNSARGDSPPLFGRIREMIEFLQMWLFVRFLGRLCDAADTDRYRTNLSGGSASLTADHVLYIYSQNKKIRIEEDKATTAKYNIGGIRSLEKEMTELDEHIPTLTFRKRAVHNKKLLRAAIPKYISETESTTGQHFIHLTSAGRKFSTRIGLLEEIVREFPVLFSTILIPFLAGVFGSDFIKLLFNALKRIIGLL